ncbi:MAG: hypothetical protein A3G34_00245 [Candidatus Lindowbacteria bacterium RIFCSPLOWO2_12_FULL_62_27]|nr:MAG: hypothetical protein A3G34_00245 [Candidatus Lindowbacteria bacterium RIFCSPLOWO2_12_FULL_62_27]OGH63379.1 MAG: hypothetical protein A3I06_08315 [Candidatus Lindowbacteria bacterium RIFCSPLOWO2_02_FULL_62_12]
MNKGLLVFTALVAFVFALPTLSEAKIEITGAALVSAQDVDFDSTSGAQDEDLNFNDPRVNLYVNGDVSDKISVTAKFWAANDWSSENQRGGRGGTGAALPGAGTNGSLGESVEMLRAYLTVKDVLGSGFDLKVGTIDIPFGYEYGMRTNNGDDMKNDFVTNSLLDINGGDEGIALSGSFDMGQTSTPLSWEVALLNGGDVTDGNPAGAGVANDGVAGPHQYNKSNDDLAWAIRAEVGLQENLTLQASWYTSDQRQDGDMDPLNIGSAFLENNINRTAPGGTMNGNLSGLVYNNRATGGYNRDVWEFAGKYDYGQGYVLAFWGNIDADTSNGNNNREYDYFGAQGRYNFDDNSYVAVRYNQIDPDYVNSNNLGEPSLWTIAAGYKLADNAMVKAEWSSFDEDGSALSQGTNTVDTVNGDADALTVSVGVSF